MSTLMMLGHKIKESGTITLVKDFDRLLPLVPAHPAELNQVWTNLIDNALQAMPDGGTLTIRTAPGRRLRAGGDRRHRHRHPAGAAGARSSSRSSPPSRSARAPARAGHLLPGDHPAPRRRPEGGLRAGRHPVPGAAAAGRAALGWLTAPLAGAARAGSVVRVVAPAGPVDAGRLDRRRRDPGSWGLAVESVTTRAPSTTSCRIWPAPMRSGRGSHRRLDRPGAARCGRPAAATSQRLVDRLDWDALRARRAEAPGPLLRRTALHGRLGGS